MKIIFHIPDDRGKLYEVIKYPAGEIQTRLTPAGIEKVTKKGVDAYEIIANPIPDVIELAQLNDAIQAARWVRYNSTFSERSLFLPYLPFARADRRFVPGDTAGFAIFMKLIEAMKFTSIWTFDAHNARLATAYGIANLLPTDGPVDQIRDCLRSMGRQSLVIVLPDAGAAKRYQDIGKYKIPFIVAGKTRDAKTGKLTGFKISDAIKYYKSALIVDDICDGGGTFIGLGEVIKKKNPNIKLGLYVSHGIFSKGHKILQQTFDQIYVSDYTFKSVYDDEFVQWDGKK